MNECDDHGEDDGDGDEIEDEAEDADGDEVPFLFFLFFLAFFLSFLSCFLSFSLSLLCLFHISCSIHTDQEACLQRDQQNAVQLQPLEAMTRWLHLFSAGPRFRRWLQQFGQSKNR